MTPGGACPRGAYLAKEVLVSRAFSLTALLLLAGAAGLVAAAPDKKADAFLGTWSGTWTGGSEGALDMTLSKGADGKLAGSITASPNAGEAFTAEFKSVTIEGQAVTATFEMPDGAAVGTLTGTFADGAGKGTYTLREKQQGTEVETGAWSVKKK